MTSAADPATLVGVGTVVWVRVSSVREMDGRVSEGAQTAPRPFTPPHTFVLISEGLVHRSFILDQALTAYVEQDKSFEEMVASGFDSSLVTRVIRTVERNEFKRRQSPIGVKITPRAFGRDRRMPIVNRYTNR